MENEKQRVNLGGCWDYGESNALVALRNWSPPGSRSRYIGVRMSRIVLPLQQLAEVNNER